MEPILPKITRHPLLKSPSTFRSPFALRNQRAAQSESSVPPNNESTGLVTLFPGRC